MDRRNAHRHDQDAGAAPRHQSALSLTPFASPVLPPRVATTPAASVTTSTSNGMVSTPMGVFSRETVERWQQQLRALHRPVKPWIPLAKPV